MELWLAAGSQDLCGEETLAEVARDAAEIAVRDALRWNEAAFRLGVT